MEIESIGWQGVPVGNATGRVFDVSISLGHSTGATLPVASVPDSCAGAMTCVFEADSIDLVPDSTGWFTIKLDTGFGYNGVENLLIEVVHAPCSDAPMVAGWNSRSPRAVQAYGSPSPLIPMMRIDGLRESSP